jgi:hypothetical protein
MIVIMFVIMCAYQTHDRITEDNYYPAHIIFFLYPFYILSWHYHIMRTKQTLNIQWCYMQRKKISRISFFMLFTRFILWSLWSKYSPTATSDFYVWSCETNKGKNLTKRMPIASSLEKFIKFTPLNWLITLMKHGL